MSNPDWFKIKGYYHISPQSKGTGGEVLKTIRKVVDPDFIARYAFYPLLHTKIIERRFKKDPTKEKGHCHSYIENGETKRTLKERPLHYANHFDALIFSYYASILQEKYEKKLKEVEGLSDCVTAYRKIPIENIEELKGKGTIHFANEAFSEVKKRTIEKGETAVLAFDIKSFFTSLDHTYLQERWKEIMEFEEMPKDHQVVLNAATKFSFIYKDDLRKFKKTRKGKRSNFNEKKIAYTAITKGFNAFFESPKDFRENVKNGHIRIFQNSFKNKQKEIIGIPQGLPISAVLANLYLFSFDKAILTDLVNKKGCYYRRYSDDIVIICDKSLIPEVEATVLSEMLACKVEISKEKTEKFIFKTRHNDGVQQVYSTKLTLQGEKIDLPFIYLGFEYYGHKTLIRAANLSKFYRRMIYAVKSKSKIALKMAEKDGVSPVIYKRHLFKIYRNINLDKISTIRRNKYFKKQETGEFRLEIKDRRKKFQGNYFSYAKRAAEIMDEPAILEQIKGEKRVFNQAIQKHFNNKL